MHRFRYRGNDLYAESVKITDIIKRYGSPLYIYSTRTVLDHFFKLRNAFKEFCTLICFSAKANSNLSLLRLLVKNGAGIDVVSGGELYKALKVGCNPEKIVYAGVGKTPAEIELGIKKGILFFNVESVSELERINEIACTYGKIQNVCLRLNPDVRPSTHKYIVTGKKDTKFGLDLGKIEKIFLNKSKYKNIDIRGIHFHIGSQITSIKPFLEAIKVALSLKKKFDFEYLNIGGGLGIIYKDEKALTVEKYAREIRKLLKDEKLKLILEPGRFIVGNAGVLVTGVTYVKKSKDKNYIITDAGMNLLIRPALYSAYHRIVLVKKRKTPRAKFDVVGPICENSDFLGQERMLASVKEGDYLAVLGTGAYGFTMSSNYNAQPKCAEVLVKDREFYLVRRSESYRDLIRLELIPDFLK